MGGGEQEGEGGGEGEGEEGDTRWGKGEGVIVEMEGKLDEPVVCGEYADGRWVQAWTGAWGGGWVREKTLCTNWYAAREATGGQGAGRAGVARRVGLGHRQDGVNARG